MNKSSILKIAGIIIISFVVIIVATFFLYPYLNEEKYEEIQQNRLEELPATTSGSSQSDIDSNLTGGGQFEYLQKELQRQKADERVWINRVDSLLAVNQKLEKDLDSAMIEINNLTEMNDNGAYDTGQLANRGPDESDIIAVSEEPQEAFSERVKSLLNLDEEELEPIANQMSHAELVRIYQNSSNMQREKLLRSLTPERAAKLMREVML